MPAPCVLARRRPGLAEASTYLQDEPLDSIVDTREDRIEATGAQTIELRDGTVALIRPIEPGDRDRLREGFDGASAESIFARFLTPVDRLSERQLDYLTAVDHDRHEALIAVDPDTGESFGTARYIRRDDDPETAEFAIGVGDRWMRLGLGTALLTALATRAREAGIARITGLVQAENAPIKRLVAKVAGAYESRPAGDGAEELLIDLR